MKQFAYISEDDGQEHTAQHIDWNDILDTTAHVEDDYRAGSLNVLDDESVAAVASMQVTLGLLICWRDMTCVDALAPRVIETCNCPVCVAIRSLELAIEHIYRIFE